MLLLGSLLVLAELPVAAFVVEAPVPEEVLVDTELETDVVAGTAGATVVGAALVLSTGGGGGAVVGIDGGELVFGAGANVAAATEVLM